MSQSTLDPNPAPEGTAQEQAPARQGSAATHRRRRSTTRKTPPRQEQEQATSAAAVVESLPASQAAAEAVAPPEMSAPPAAAETAAPARPRAASRSRRRSANGRKNDVQLVISPHAGEDSTTEKSTAPSGDTAPVAEEPQTPAAEVRAVPVTTEQTETAAPSAREPAEAEAAEAETLAEARTSSRRYRFDRKATAAPYAPASRPERLSGVRVIPSAEAAAPTEPVAPVQEPAAAHMAAPEERDEVSALEEEVRAGGAIDDIVSALGLRDAAPRREPLRLPVEIEAPAAEETAAEAAEEASEAEEASAAETEASGTSRRRRRRRRGGAHAASAGEEDAEEMLATAPRRPTPLTEPEPAKRNGYSQYAGQEYGEELEPIYTPYGETARQPWDITQAQAQIRQPESPFEAPEPSTVRGFGPQPRGVAGPAREPFTRPGRVERTDVPPMSSNQLASMVTHAIQQQTDRLLNELHYRAQPPGMTVMLPSLPSTERVGVFVDVANLLYSSRNLRLTVDFGKLLEFLRGNRRLVRAHAYAPTNPDPHADQSFLQAVKGLGYRITTKNYKTFASGAKKADMDLDLCMDIVRMVDASAVDTIVLVSGDSDFLPLLEYCSDHGVRVEVAAFEDAAAAILRQSCDLFINLSLVDDIRA